MLIWSFLSKTDLEWITVDKQEWKRGFTFSWSKSTINLTQEHCGEGEFGWRAKNIARNCILLCYTTEPKARQTTEGSLEFWNLLVVWGLFEKCFLLSILQVLPGVFCSFLYFYLYGFVFPVKFFFYYLVLP